MVASTRKPGLVLHVVNSSKLSQSSLRRQGTAVLSPQRTRVPTAPSECPLSALRLRRHSSLPLRRQLSPTCPPRADPRRPWPRTRRWNDQKSRCPPRHSRLARPRPRCRSRLAQARRRCRSRLGRPRRQSLLQPSDSPEADPAMGAAPPESSLGSGERCAEVPPHATAAKATIAERLNALVLRLRSRTLNTIPGVK